MRKYLDLFLAALAALLIGIGVDAGSVMYANASQANYGVTSTPTAAAAPYQPPTAVSPVRPESTRTVLVHGVLAQVARYHIVAGDTLSGISGRTYGSGQYWPAIYAANKITIKNPNLIYPGQTIGIPAKPAHLPSVAAPKTAAPSGEDDSTPAPTPTHSTPVTTVSSSNLSGTLGCNGLEALWMAAGGRQSSAFIAAEIAMAESGGRQYAHSPTNDFGYWQINGVHGSMATYNPLGNARAAVSISSNGTNWNPWTTYRSGAYQGQCSSLTAASRIGIPTPGSSSSTRASRALAWALTQAGKWYAWGGAGPNVYDCSGLVMRAYERVGIDLPHNTGVMLHSGRLHRTFHPHRGDVMMWGGNSPYHIEFYINSSTSYGAHQTGKRISEASIWGSPWFYTVS